MCSTVVLLYGWDSILIALFSIACFAFMPSGTHIICNEKLEDTKKLQFVKRIYHVINISYLAVITDTWRNVRVCNHQYDLTKKSGCC